jgi:predicted aminopeptidase
MYLLGLHAKGVPFAALQRQPQLEEELEECIRLVLDIKAFAQTKIGLKEDDNYTRYIQVPRNYLADIVSACPSDNLKTHEWTFPIIGSVPYKGFFSKEGAEREADRLERSGMDVWIRKVDAFSTLGIVKDPVYSFMVTYPPFSLAELIIHEQTHTTIFLPNQIEFNESLAQFVGSRGALGYIRNRFGEDSEYYEKIIAYKKDRRTFSRLMNLLYEEAEDLYDDPASNLSYAKEKLFLSYSSYFQEEYDHFFVTDLYRGFVPPVNNAWLSAFKVYNRKGDIFLRLYRSVHEDLGTFMRLLLDKEEEMRKSGDPFGCLENLLQELEKE